MIKIMKIFKFFKNDSFDRISDHIELHSSLPRYRAMLFRKADSFEQRLLVIPFDGRSSPEYDASLYCSTGWLVECCFDFNKFDTFI